MEVPGERLKLIHEVVMEIMIEERNYSRLCKVKTDRLIHCWTPSVPMTALGARDLPVSLRYLFMPNDKNPMKNNFSMDVYPDPKFVEFSIQDASIMRIKYSKGMQLTIYGENLTMAAREIDFKVYIGSVLCNVTTLNPSFLTCTVPPVQPQSINSKNQYPEVLVRVGGSNLKL